MERAEPGGRAFKQFTRSHVNPAIASTLGAAEAKQPRLTVLETQPLAALLQLLHQLLQAGAPHGGGRLCTQPRAAGAGAPPALTQ